jgi:hypothetical protein
LYEQLEYSSHCIIHEKFNELGLADYAKSDEANAMSLYINVHRSLRQQLQSSGAIIDNETEHYVLLFSLGDSYDIFIITTAQSFWHNDNDNQNYTDVDNILSPVLDDDRWEKGVKLGMEHVEIASSSNGSALCSNQKRS